MMPDYLWFGSSEEYHNCRHLQSRCALPSQNMYQYKEKAEIKKVSSNFAGKNLAIVCRREMG